MRHCAFTSSRLTGNDAGAMVLTGERAGTQPEDMCTLPSLNRDYVPVQNQVNVSVPVLATNVGSVPPVFFHAYTFSVPDEMS